VRWKVIVPALALVLGLGAAAAPVAMLPAAAADPVTFDVQNFNEPQEYVGRFLTLRFQGHNNTTRPVFMTVSVTVPKGLTLLGPDSISPPCPTFPDNCFIGLVQPSSLANLDVFLRVDAPINTLARGTLVAETECPAGLAAAAACAPIFNLTDTLRVVTFLSPVVLTIGVAPQPAWVGGDPMTVTYTIRNIHTSDIFDVVLTTGLPAGWVSTSGCAPPPQPCAVGTIGRGGSVTRTYRRTPGVPGTTPVNARVTATFDACNDGCFETANATAVAQVRIAPLPVLTVSPGLGPPGFVAIATGTGFPNGAKVKLTWVDPSGQPLLTENLTLTVVNGGFSTQVLIFRRDQLGPRSLNAASAGGTRFAAVTASFLVVPPIWIPPLPQRG
jgi:hypothetical protein